MQSLIPKMSTEPDVVVEQGTSILGSLFGSGTISGIVNALAKFSKIAPGTSQKLIAYLIPMVLSAIAGQFKGKSISAQGLASMFADQKTNIANSLPSGFSLSDVPGLAAAGTATARSAVRTVETATSPATRWLMPVMALAALGLLGWWLLPSLMTPAPEAKPAPVIRAQSPETHLAPVTEVVKTLTPDVTRFSSDLKETFSKLTEALTSVKDAASAEAALPKLQDIEGKLVAAKTTTKELGDAGRTAVKTLVAAAETKLKELLAKVLAMPGVGEKLKTVVDSITAKLTELGA